MTKQKLDAAQLVLAASMAVMLIAPMQMQSQTTTKTDAQPQAATAAPLQIKTPTRPLSRNGDGGVISYLKNRVFRARPIPLLRPMGLE